MKKNKKAFTIVELMVVLLVIAILMGVLLVNPFGIFKKAKTTAVKLQIKRIQLALERFREKVGRYPDTDEGLKALIEKPPTIEDNDWEKFLEEKKAIKDPWGRYYLYESDDGSSYKLYTLGSDGKEGGKGEAKDVICSPDGCQ